MTVSVTGVTSPHRTIPYLTPEMFKSHARRGVQINNLVPKGTEAQQDAALAVKIKAASAWCDDVVGPAMMAATKDTFQERVNISRRGEVSIFPRYRPVVGVTAFAIGADPSSLRDITNLSNFDVQENHFTAPVGGGALITSAGPLEFGAIGSPWDQALCRYTYVNGFPVTTMTAAAAAGATSITVADTTGIVAGKTWMTIYALQDQVTFLATSVSTADAGGLGFGPGTVGCAALPSGITVPDPLYPPMISALPSSVLEAVTLATRAMIKESSPSAAAKGAPSAGDDFVAAEKILSKYFVLDA